MPRLLNAEPASDELAAAPEAMPAPPRWRELLRTRTVLAVLAAEVLIALTVVYGLWAMRSQALDGELRMLASLSGAMAAQADSTLDVADAVLRATRAELSAGLLLPGTDAAHDFLRARAAALPKFRALAVLDAQGKRLATSREEVVPALSPASAHAASGAASAAAAPTASPTPSLANSDFFVAARDRSGPALFVGSPYLSPADSRPSIGVSTDWRSTGDEFKGVVVLVADAEFLDGDFEHIAPTPDTSLAIYRRDHVLVSDGPGDGTPRLLPASVMDAVWASPTPEVPRLATLPDGRQRLVAAHLLHRFPLMVVVTRDAQVVLAAWTEQAWLVGSFAASALGVTLLLTLRNGREQHLRRASQAALAAEQERAVRAFRAAREGHWEWNAATGASHLSPRMKELLGIGREEPLASPLGLLARGSVHPDDIEGIRAAFITHQQGGTPRLDISFRARHADGLWHHVRARGELWRGAQGQPLLFNGTAADVTAEVAAQTQTRQLEDQLQRARKLEALGTLAGGIAHDFNNILAAVIGYGEMARGAAPADSGQARQLDQVLQAGQRGKALVERILSFSRSGPRLQTTFLLTPVVDEVLTLLAASLPASIRLEKELRAPGAVVRGDATMVYEAATNLCTNAMQAMQALAQGGTLVVELVVVTLNQPRALFDKSLAAGVYACLSITDTGPGIAPEVMARMFEPFFTTKGPRAGTGLGLAVVHGVMADLGGAIDVQTEPGRGARFVLYFPCVEAAPAGTAPSHRANQADHTATAAAEAGRAAADNADLTSAANADVPDTAPVPTGQGQTVLVVDDEPALVALAEELLAGLGYEPVGLASSVQALADFKCDPGRFDLVITDEVMPQMTGTALTTALHALRPGLPVVLVSGYGGPQLAARAAAAGVAVLVKKPLVRAELAAAIAQALKTSGV